MWSNTLCEHKQRVKHALSTQTTSQTRSVNTNNESNTLCQHKQRVEVTCKLPRPTLNKKLFPVHRPGGSKRADWNFFFYIFKKTSFFSLFPLYILVFKKKEIREKNKIPTSRLAFFPPTRPTGNNFLRVLYQGDY